MSLRTAEFDLGRCSAFLFTISTLALFFWLALTIVQSDTKREADSQLHALLERLEGNLDKTATLARSIRGLMQVDSGLSSDILKRYLEGIEVNQNYKELLSINVLIQNQNGIEFKDSGIFWFSTEKASQRHISGSNNEIMNALAAETVSTQRTRFQKLADNQLGMTIPVLYSFPSQVIFCVIDIGHLSEQWLYDVSRSEIALSVDGNQIFTVDTNTLFKSLSYREQMILGRKVQVGIASSYQYSSLRSQALIILILFQLLSTALLFASYRTQNRLRNLAEEASHAREEALLAERTARNGMERALRVKDEFLGTVSHELRSPLNAILGWAQLLLRSKVNEEQLERGLTVIERNVQQQTRLIEDLLDLSRSASGKLLLERKKFMLHHLVEDQVEQATLSALPRNISLIVKKLEPVMFVGDERRFQQIIGNLLHNAIKFSNQGGTIFVSLEIRDNLVRLEVEDDGIGIGSGYLSNMFGKFQQHDSTTTRQHGGLGIGLSIVKLFTELHGGEVWGESTGKGEGSRFVVTLPIDSEQNLTGSSTVLEDPTVSEEDARMILRGAKILIVDDEDDAREIVSQIFKESGASVVEANSAQSALAAYALGNIDAIVSDIGMPIENGYFLARKIRGLAVGSDIPLVALSALARLEDKNDAINAGYDDHVSKPLNTFELISKVATLIFRYRSTDAVHSKA